MSRRAEASGVSWPRVGCVFLIIAAAILLFLVPVVWLFAPRPWWGPEDVHYVLLFGGPFLVALLVAVLVARRSRAIPALAALFMLAAVILIPLAMEHLNEFYEKSGRPEQSICLSHLKMVALCQHMYAADHDDHFPPAEHWPQGLDEYLGDYTDHLLCPSDERPHRQKSGKLETSYTMSDAFGGVQYGAVKAPARLGVFFDGTDLYGRHEAVDFRHAEVGWLGKKPEQGGANVAFADGHCGWVRQEDFGKLRLEP